MTNSCHTVFVAVVSCVLGVVVGVCGVYATRDLWVFWRTKKEHRDA